MVTKQTDLYLLFQTLLNNQPIHKIQFSFPPKTTHLSFISKPLLLPHLTKTKAPPKKLDICQRGIISHYIYLSIYLSLSLSTYLFPNSIIYQFFYRIYTNKRKNQQKKSNECVFVIMLVFVSVSVSVSVSRNNTMFVVVAHFFLRWIDGK